MDFQKYKMHAAWTLSVMGTSGSLFFSEVMNLPPCVLCWYQRIAMYPLVIILGIGILWQDAKAKIYGLSLVIPGLLIAAYHVLLYYGVIPDSISPCTKGVSCTTKQIEWLGFVTIPLLSFLSFLVLAFLLLPEKKKK